MNSGKIFHKMINLTRYGLDFYQVITNILFSHNPIFNGDNYSFFLNSVNGLQQFIRFKNCKSSWFYEDQKPSYEMERNIFEFN